MGNPGVRSSSLTLLNTRVGVPCETTRGHSSAPNSLRLLNRPCREHSSRTTVDEIINDNDDDDTVSFCYSTTDAESDYWSSSDDELSCLGADGDGHDELGKGTRLKVVFGQLEVREYAVTVGDHPSTNDTCPLTLSWDYCTTLKESVRDNSFRSDQSSLRSLRPLTLVERRQRVAITQDISTAQVRRLELHMLLDKLKDLETIMRGKPKSIT